MFQSALRSSILGEELRNARAQILEEDLCIANALLSTAIAAAGVAPSLRRCRISCSKCDGTLAAGSVRKSTGFQFRTSELRH